MEYKIFCDESCHLLNDGWDVMTLGAIKIYANEYKKIKNDIKEIKLKHKNPFEIKWTKLSYSRMPLYKELIDYFIKSNITYRSVTVINKHKLTHKSFNQTHSDFYYKTYYLVLKKIINENDSYKIYMDLKDTKGKVALMKLKNVFENSKELPTPFMQHIRFVENSTQTHFLWDTKRFFIVLIKELGNSQNLLITAYPVYRNKYRKYQKMLKRYEENKR